jgi:hypothetical protein
MIKLIVDNAKQRPTLVPVEVDPQARLDAICSQCFLIRGYYLESIPQNTPFDRQRAMKIFEVLSGKGAQDPKSYALAHALRNALTTTK